MDKFLNSFVGKTISEVVLIEEYDNDWVRFNFTDGSDITIMSNSSDGDISYLTIE